MDISALTSFLAPFLPSLLSAARDAGEDLAEKVGDEAFGFAKRIWARLRPRVEAEPAARDAAEKAAAAAGDERRLVALTLQLEDLLAADAELAADIERLFTEAERAGAVQVTITGTGNVGIGGSANDARIVIGDQNQVGG